jgi:hypothetical protein
MNTIQIVPFNEINNINDNINDICIINIDKITNNSDIDECDIDECNIRVKPINNLIILPQQEVFLVNDSKISCIYIIFGYLYRCNWFKIFIYYIFLFIFSLIVSLYWN